MEFYLKSHMKIVMKTAAYGGIVGLALVDVIIVLALF
jgi:hypothetical protein